MTVKAGTAYIAFEPIGLTELKRKLQAQVTAASQSAGNAGSRVLSNAVSSGTAVTRMFGRVNSAMAGTSRALRNLGSQVGMLGYQFQMAGAMASLAFTAPVAAITAAGTAVGLKFAMNVENAMVALKALLPAGYDVDALMKRLQKTAVASPVFATDDLITFTQRMVSAGISVKTTERFLNAFGNIAITSGMSTDKMTNALEAFSQMAGKGVVNMEELRQQLGDALPGALKIAADGMGVTQAKLFDMVAAGEVTASELMAAFIKVGESGKYVAGAASGADTLSARWQQLKEQVTTALGNAVLANMEQIKAAFDQAQPSVDRMLGAFVTMIPTIVAGFTTLAGYVSSALALWDSLDQKIQDNIKRWAAISTAVGPVLLVLGSVSVALSAIVSAAGFFTSTAGLVVAAVAAVAAGLAWLGTKIAEGKGAFAGIKDAVMVVVDAFRNNVVPVVRDAAQALGDVLVDKWERLKLAMKADAFQNTIQVFKAIWEIVKIVAKVVWDVLGGAFKAVGPIVGAVIDIFMGLWRAIDAIIGFIVGVFTLDFEKMRDSSVRLMTSLKNMVVDVVKGLWNALVAIVKGLVNGIVDLFTWLWDILVGHSIIPDLVNAIVDWFKSLPGKVVAFVKSLVVKAVEIFTMLKDRVVSAVKALVSGAVDRFRELISKFQAIATAVKDKVSSVIDKVKALPGQIKNAIGNAATMLYQIGKDIVKGLINGINSMIGDLKAKVSSLSSLITGTTKKMMEIGSPSRVMYQLGQWVTEGLSLGMSAEVPALNNTSASVAQAIISPVTGEAEGMAQKGATLSIDNFQATEKQSPQEIAESLSWLSLAGGWAV